MDFTPGFEALRKAGYDGYIEVESRSLSGPAADVLPQTADYLRGLLKATGTQ